MPRVFMSFHDDETSAYADALSTGLWTRYGQTDVLTGVEVPADERGVDALDRAVRSCDVVLVLIGRSWLSRVVADRGDRVRREVEIALKGGVPVLPVVVGEGAMPAAEDLPTEIAALAHAGGMELRNGPESADVERVVDRLEPIARRHLTRAMSPRAESVEAAAAETPPLGRRLESWARAGVVPTRVPAPVVRARAPAMMTRAKSTRRGRLEHLPEAASSIGGWVDPDVEADLVGCTVFAPPSVARGDSVLLQVFAHLAADADDARAIATELDPGTKRRAYRTLESPIRRGIRLTFELRVPGVEIPEPVESLVWRGRAEAVQFGVSVPVGLDRTTLLGTVEVSVDGVPLGRMTFQLVVGEPLQPEPVGDQARRYTAAFISYASEDRAEVLARVQMLSAVEIRYFQDLLDLDPGDRWERALYREIDNCDLFLLFWSSQAKDSQWVRREVQYALARAGGDEEGLPAIRPVIIEGPPIVKPWEELADLHFNDRILYFMAAPEDG